MLNAVNREFCQRLLPVAITGALSSQIMMPKAFSFIDPNSSWVEKEHVDLLASKISTLYFIVFALSFYNAVNREFCQRLLPIAITGVLSSQIMMPKAFSFIDPNSNWVEKKDVNLLASKISTLCFIIFARSLYVILGSPQG